MLTVDYHTHNSRCGHAQGTIEEYIKAAIARGLTEIGISDHSPIYWQDGNDPMPTTAMAKDELEGYVEEVLALKAKYTGQINVRLGLECDYIEHMEDFYRDLLAKYPFDYAIGSVHYVFGRNVYDSRRWNDQKEDPMTVYAEYYRLVEKSARSGLYNILAHTTAITAYAPKPIPQAIEALQDQALHTIRDSGVCVEINTSGYRKMNDPFPTARMIERAHNLGIPLTFSSDSHRPDEVAHARDKVEKLLALIGVGEIATFANRQRTMVAFQPETVLV